MVDGVIRKEVFHNLLDILVQKQSVKRNKTENRECLSLPEKTLQVSHELLTFGQKSVDSSQTTVESSQLIEDSSQATVETLCSKTFTQSNFQGALNLKVQLENLKLQIIAGIKDLIFSPFQANVPFLYPLKASENLWFFYVFRGYRKGTLA